jgi:hypothetical protein
LTIFERSLSHLTFACVAFVADDDAGPNVGPDVERGFEATPIEGFAAGQAEGDDVPGGVRFCELLLQAMLSRDAGVDGAAQHRFASVRSHGDAA